MSSSVRRMRPALQDDAVNTTRPAVSIDEALEIRRVKCVLTESLFKRFLRRLFPDQRNQERVSMPPLVGYLGTVRSTKPYDVWDISLTGFCLLTDERWDTGTEMPVTLRRTDVIDEIDADCFTVQATVVRSGKGGVGFSILLSENDSKAAYGNPLRVKWTSKPEMAQFLMRLKQQDSAASAGEGATSTHQAAGAPIKTRASLRASFEAGRRAGWTQAGSD